MPEVCFIMGFILNDLLTFVHVKIPFRNAFLALPITYDWHSKWKDELAVPDKKQPSHPPRKAIFEGQEYISFRAAARILGISHTTLYQWSRKGIAGNGTPLDVIEDTLTNQHLISSGCVQELMATRFRRSLASLGEKTLPEESSDPVRDAVLQED
jgi:hypothetical protein